MRTLEVKKLESLAAGYCDGLIYTLTGECTNPGCIYAELWNTYVVPTDLGFNRAGCLE
jgi:hypothetical protein